MLQRKKLFLLNAKRFFSSLKEIDADITRELIFSEYKKQKEKDEKLSFIFKKHQLKMISANKEINKYFPKFTTKERLQLLLKFINKKKRKIKKIQATRSFFVFEKYFTMNFRKNKQKSKELIEKPFLLQKYKFQWYKNNKKKKKILGLKVFSKLKEKIPTLSFIKKAFNVKKAFKIKKKKRFFKFRFPRKSLKNLKDIKIGKAKPKKKFKSFQNFYRFFKLEEKIFKPIKRKFHRNLKFHKNPKVNKAIKVNRNPKSNKDMKVNKDIKINKETLVKKKPRINQQAILDILKL